MNWRTRGVTFRLGRYGLQIGASVTGCDRWLVIERNSIIWAWSAPRWMSVMRMDGRLRGG